MGRRMRPKTLQDVCLHNIAKNMEGLWCADYYKNFHDRGTFLHFIGPFTCLTPDLIQQLIHCLVVNGWMKRYYLHLMIDWRFESLNLSVCKKAANKDFVIKLVAARCEKLTELNLAGCNQLSTRLLSELVRCLPRLTSLTLRHTKCGDQVLAEVGRCCRSLRELDVYGCPVTDVGVESLCSGPAAAERLLYRLDIAFTAVSHRAVEIAVRRCRRLIDLNYPDTCAALCRMEASGAFDDGRIELPLRLRALHLMLMKDADCDPDECLRVACLRCPDAAAVSIHRGATDRGVLRLCQLERLSRLQLANDARGEVTFEGGLLPLLRINGSGIEQLVLGEISRLDLGLIGRCCPLLRRLDCLWSGRGVPALSVDTRPEIVAADGDGAPFRRLEELRLAVYTENDDIPADAVRLLLAGAVRLRQLHLVQIQPLTDELLCGVLDENPLSDLQRLSLERCDHLGPDAVASLCLMDNDLAHLSMRNCGQLSRRDFDQLRNLAAENKLDLVIEWS